MKIFGFFYSEKVSFTKKKKKNSTIAQQRRRLVILISRDDNMGVERLVLFFLILKPIPFKKLRTARLHLIFVFIFYYIKDKNIMNFYKLFINKHYNNNYYLY